MSEHVETYSEDFIQSIELAQLKRDLIKKDAEIKKIQSSLDKVKCKNIELIEQIEALKEALDASHGSVKKTAQMLGINRKTIQRYIKQYNITKQQ